MTISARNEAPVVLRRLLPQDGELTADELVAELRPWELATAQRPHVAVNMVHTTDGRASVDGRTAPISTVADRQLFHALRTRVDAIMIGAGTLRVERYGRLVRDAARREQRRVAGLQPDPLAIVVSGSLELPADLPLLQDPDSRVVIVTSSVNSIEGVGADVQYLRFPGRVDLAAALATLRTDSRVRSILCEGGPHLNASLIAGGLIDELFLTTFPQIAGGGGALSIMDDAPLDAPVTLSLLSLCEHTGELFARYAIDRAARDEPAPG
ncbi:MAG TPA: dihydrofolate reductase family protein [Solirubrobacteraceae bacterium]|nr:dihydrofolate reductase family protein [Solirubrobacteraceae bacterium]